MRIILVFILFFPAAVFSQITVNYDDLLDSNLNTLKEKHELGADLSQGIGKYQRRPIIIAIEKNQFKVLEYLLKNGGEKYAPRAHGFRNDFPNPSLYEDENSFLYMGIFNSSNPMLAFELVSKYTNMEKYLDIALFYSISPCTGCIELSKRLIKMGAKPTTIFTVSEVGEISNCLKKTWPSNKSSMKNLTAHHLILKWVMNNENLSQDDVYKKYVMPMHNGPYNH